MNTDFAARRARVAVALNLGDDILLVGAGQPVPKPEISDQVLPFIAHQEYYYLTGLAGAPGGIVTFDPRQGPEQGWTSFVPEVTEAEKIWEGREELPGEPLGNFAAWLGARRGRRVVMLGAIVPGVEWNEPRTTEVRATFLHARRAKEPGEIELMQRCAAATAAGYAAIQPLLKPGVSERAIQIELEAEFFRHGAQKTGYDTIVGVGAQSAVFHGAPSPQRLARPGDFILIDSGAELDRYVIDVTRTYFAGQPSVFQRDLYQIVLNAQERGVRAVPPGRRMEGHPFCRDRRSGGRVGGDGSDEGRARIARRTGSAPAVLSARHRSHARPRRARRRRSQPGRTRDSRPCLRNLRMDLILRPGYIVTVEPGLYFIPALLQDPTRRERYRDCVNWPAVDSHLGVGGVRLEDNLLVTGDEPLNLTAAIPKQL